MTPQQKLKLLLDKRRLAAAALIANVPMEVINELDNYELDSAKAGVFDSGDLDQDKNSATITLQSGQSITYNEKQQLAISTALAGDSLCLTGPAGSGKTTTVKGIIAALLKSSRNVIMEGVKHKHLPSIGVPGIVTCAYTNKAVSNVKKNLDIQIRQLCLTIHKLLEFEPVYYDDVDPITGNKKSKMEFKPARNRGNPLPSGIYVIILEESSMIDVPLWNMLIDALPTDIHSQLQIIMIGDIQQLPPVFGKSIYIHAMQKGMKTVELTEVYRQALESPILSLAHRVLSGKMIRASEFEQFTVDKTAENKGKVQIRPWKKSFSDIAAMKVMSLWLPQAIDSGAYNPEQDIILTPFNKSFGTVELNHIVATHQAKRLNADVYEIFTGINKVYYRVGERVLYNKSEARIIGIKTNGSYYGKIPRAPSNTMDYKGVEQDPSKFNIDTMSEDDKDAALDHIDKMFSAMADHTSEEGKTARSASHIITVRDEDTGTEWELRSAGDVTSLALGYAITIHKAQGSEYGRVFLITHKSQSIMFYRELLYTGITRAKNELYIICEPNFFVQGIQSQRLPGANAAEKIKNFDRMMEVEWKMTRGGSNKDQVPVGLERFIKVEMGVVEDQ